VIKVYDSLQDEIKAKNKKMKNLQDELFQAKGEVEDLQVEFEREREDYLETIRKQETQMALQKLLLEKVQPLLRRDCNYSNLDRIMSESKWDDERKMWILPEVIVERTALPMAGGIAPSPRKSKTGASPPNGYYDTHEEDKFLQHLNRTDSSEIAASYFAPKRANRLLESQNLRRPDNNGDSTIYKRASSPFHERVSPTEAYPASTMRPVRLESLNPSLVGGKKGKKKKQLDSL
jgi:kinesin family protein 3/17